MKTVGKTGYDGNNLRYMNNSVGGNLDWLYATGLKSSDLFLFIIQQVTTLKKMMFRSSI